MTADSDSPCSGPLSARSWRWWWPPASCRLWEAGRWCAWRWSATAFRDPFIGLTDSLGTFFVAFLLWGFFQGMLDVSMNTQAITVERFSGRVLMPGFHGSWSTGALVGAVTGAVAVGLGLSLSEQLLALAVPCLLVVGWLTTSLIADQRAGGDPEPSEGTPDRRSGVLQGAVLVLGGIAFADMLCEGAAADWAAVYLRNSLHAVPLVAGLAYAAYALAMLTVRLSGNRIFTRFACPSSATTTRRHGLGRLCRRSRHRPAGDAARSGSPCSAPGSEASSR